MRGLRIAFAFSLERSPKRLNPKNRIVSVFLDELSEKCEKIRV
jgi:hypothetical protein